MTSYLPYTKAYKVRKGLELTREFTTICSTKNEVIDAFDELEKDILRCHRSKICMYNANNFKEMVNKISPGLINSNIIRNMIKAVTYT